MPRKRILNTKNEEILPLRVKVFLQRSCKGISDAAFIDIQHLGELLRKKEIHVEGKLFRKFQGYFFVHNWHIPTFSKTSIH